MVFRRGGKEPEKKKEESEIADVAVEDEEDMDEDGGDLLAEIEDANQKEVLNITALTIGIIYLVLDLEYRIVAGWGTAIATVREESDEGAEAVEIYLPTALEF